MVFSNYPETYLTVANLENSAKTPKRDEYKRWQNILFATIQRHMRFTAHNVQMGLIFY